MDGYKVILKKRNIIGECPYYNEKDNAVYQIDIDSKRFIKIDYDTFEAQELELPQKIGCFVFDVNNRPVFAMEDGIYNSEFKLLHEKINISGFRFNDGKVSPDGVFYAGTSEPSGKGKLYRLLNGRLETVFENITISNGIDWSPDGKTMYYCDSPTKEVVCFDYPDMANRRVIFKVNEENTVPDGLCTDNDGNVWIALWGGGRVVCVDATKAEVIREVRFDVSKISCPAFVGKNYDKLCVTSAAKAIEEKDEPLAGSTFLTDVGVCGRKPYLMKY